MVEIYTEPLQNSEHIRKLYADSVDNAVKILQEHSKKERHTYVTPQSMAENREFYRSEYTKMLGIDVCKEVFGTGIPNCDISDVGTDALCSIKRMKFEISKDVYFTGLMLIPHTQKEKSPLAVMSHGGGGSPELCCDIVGQNNYGGVVRKLLSKGFIVFAPQLLLWDLSPKLCESEVPAYTAQYNRLNSNNDLKQCGTSIAGFEIYCISRAIDFLLSLPYIEAEKCGMLGLSYGGFYTLYTMAYDTRIKCGWSAAFFNDRTKYSWHDMTWCGSGRKFLDQEVAGLCAPRRLVCDIGSEDTVFDANGVENLFPKVSEFYKCANADGDIRMNLWDGGHRFCPQSFDFFADYLI